MVSYFKIGLAILLLNGIAVDGFGFGTTKHLPVGYGVDPSPPVGYGVDPCPTRGLLYPRESVSRDVRLLDGIWTFVACNTSGLYKECAKVNATIPMPVPASYNDITVEQTLRDFVGTVRYQRLFYVPRTWQTDDQRIWLRFGSVHYAAKVFLNDMLIAIHSIGHLPFEVEITNYILKSVDQKLTVYCDNILTNHTVPQGNVVKQPGDHGMDRIQTYTFDFFNYAGIHRSVHLYTTPLIYIKDVQVITELDNKTPRGILRYDVKVGGRNEMMYDPPIEPLFLHMQLRDKDSVLVAQNKTNVGIAAEMTVTDAKRWWPYLMSDEPGYLYTLEVFLHQSDKSLLDVYRMKVGFRQLSWDTTSLSINGKPIYFRGVGRHEDSDIRGKGLDLALLARDFNLLKWLGVNAYRTSHYPYSEESMQFADEQGIMIIDESSAVALDNFNDQLLANHKSALEQLMHRDRNHPSVVMWSIANEPRSGKPESEKYFQDVTRFVRKMDKTRPITASTNVESSKCQLAQFVDIISFNRYNAWYAHTGHLDMITGRVVSEACDWHEVHNKPVLMSEYGAGTMEGLHFLPAFVWSEDYQSAVLPKHFEAFDVLRRKKWFIGEFIWNQADFKTNQGITRVGGNKKGVFTRNRQPKTAAYLLRQRYFALAHELDMTKVPKDVFNYIIDWAAPPRDEL